MTQPVIFISYSHKDEKEKDRLLSHLGVLQHQGLIGLWSDDRIGVGADWKQEISEAMAQAKVAILLISANFLNSRFILGEEVPTLLERRKSEGLNTFPVITKPCAWQEVDWLTEMNVRPKNGRPIWGAGNRRVDEDLAAIAKEVAAIVKTGSHITPTDSGVYGKSERANQSWPQKVSEVFNTMPRDGTRGSTVWLKRQEPEQQLEGYLETPHVSICIDGPTGTGKSSLATTVLRRKKIEYRLIQVTTDMTWLDFCGLLLEKPRRATSGISTKVEGEVEKGLPAGKFYLELNRGHSP